MTSRQHAETTVTELIGLPCNRLVSEGATGSHVTAVLADIGGRWFRFFIDEGVFFLSPSEPPGEDREPDSRHIDIPTKLPGVAGDPTIIKFEFHAGELFLMFSSGEFSRFIEDPETSMMKVESDRGYQLVEPADLDLARWQKNDVITLAVMKWLVAELDRELGDELVGLDVEPIVAKYMGTYLTFGVRYNRLREDIGPQLEAQIARLLRERNVLDFVKFVGSSSTDWGADLVKLFEPYQK